MTRKQIQFVILGIFLCLGKFAHAQMSTDQQCMATAIYYEAGGESLRGQYAVGEVIMNRLQAGVASSVCEVIKQHTRYHWQFGFVSPVGSRKLKPIPTKQYDHFLKIAQTIIDRKNDFRLPSDVLYFNNVSFDTKCYKLYCKIGHQLFFYKLKS